MNRRLSGGGRRKRGHSRKLLLLLCLAAALLVGLELLLAPSVSALAQQRSRSLALQAMTQAILAQSGEDGLGYQELVSAERDEQGRVSLLVTDTRRLNRLVSAVSLDAGNRLEALSRQQMHLPLGSVLGSTLMAGRGPSIPFRFTALGAPGSELRSEFSAAGVNQTRHSIYLDLSCKIRVIAPFSRQEMQVSATMLLAEGIILGDVPDTYLSLEGGQLIGE